METSIDIDNHRWTSRGFRRIKKGLYTTIFQAAVRYFRKPKMDALVRQLNALGYQPVFLPQTDYEPPELYNFSHQQRRLVRRGALSHYLPKGIKIPVADAVLADIKYQYTTSKKAAATASFLQNSLRCIGINALPKLDLKFAGSEDFSFAFTNVTCRRLDAAQIDHLVQKLELGAIPNDIVEAGRLHIAYEYAYATELLMSRGDHHAFSADISGKVGDYIDIGTEGSVTMSSKSTISFKGARGQRAAFAYKAGYLSREDEDSKWEFHPEEMNRSEGPSPYLPAAGVVLTVE
ncbi:hypothetical protein HFO26_14565 [Rhizobium leguminosarum]|uniref:hypothetical protein n=1 Tax=Rhizobium leguminosarum TaxID=384 RepID=UPI001C9422BB|nr:hypothetical protein [Rhizobium leguminosarum]MBY5731501.1 hypothetical protein [Rhizobium leguminosarum]